MPVGDAIAVQIGRFVPSKRNRSGDVGLIILGKSEGRYGGPRVALNLLRQQVGFRKADFPRDHHVLFAVRP